MTLVRRVVQEEFRELRSDLDREAGRGQRGELRGELLQSASGTTGLAPVDR